MVESKKENDENVKLVHEVYPRLFISSVRPARDPVVIETLGITHVLCLIPTNYQRDHKEVKYLKFDEIQDDSAQQLLSYFSKSNKFIHDALAENESNKVLVHCAAGISRSSSFCCAYMISHGKMKLNDALD